MSAIILACLICAATQPSVVCDGGGNHVWWAVLVGGQGRKGQKCKTGVKSGVKKTRTYGN